MCFFILCTTSINLNLYVAKTICLQASACGKKNESRPTGGWNSYILGCKFFQNHQETFRRSHFSVINSSRFYVCSMMRGLPPCSCRCNYVHVFMGVCESPWSGRPPPQGLHFWSTGCALQAWPRGSNRSGWMEFQPSAGAPAFPPPQGPQGGLRDRHTHP